MTMTDNNAFLGIDIAKATFNVALLLGRQRQERQFSNDQDGFQQLQRWLNAHCAPQVHACLEATGRYGDQLADFLYQAGHAVSVVNPAQIKAYGQSKLQRGKSDQLDARLIADFCHSQAPALWQPPAPEQRELRELVRRLDDLQHIRTQERNRLHSGPTSALVLADLQAGLADLRRRIQALSRAITAHLKSWTHLYHAYRLLRSIPGIGHLTAARLLAEIGDIHAFQSAKQVAAFIGLTPSEYTSGTSVRRRAHISKKGNAALRGNLYWPAITAMRRNPVVARLADRHRQAGKPALVTIVAAMRKLVTLAFGVLKSNRPFDPAIPLAAFLST
jgi:transposase